MENGALWGAISTAVVGIVTAIVGYLSLRHKASAKTVENLEEDAARANKRAAAVEAEFNQRVERLEKYHAQEIARINEQIDGITQEERECKDRVRKLTRQLQEHALSAVETNAKIRELFLEVERMSGLHGDKGGE